MSELTDEIFSTVVGSIMRNDEEELFSKTQEELEDYWFFVWDESRSVYYNMYEFFQMMELYSERCERWENHHNGNICIVERVRDKYLMPKIKKMVTELFDHREKNDLRS